ncbi:MAG: preprotein translocase subunit SecD [Mycobacteriaceae bacterium]|nr:preprotein translocase subunit SecD [Mycobacteriaceae bacterium]
MSRRRIEITRRVVAVFALAGLGIGAIALVGGLLTTVFGHQQKPLTLPPQSPATSGPTVTPGPPIPPLPVRPVQDATPATADQCPADGQAPAAPTDVLVACDPDRTTVYTLGPQVMELELTQVESLKSPTSESNVVRITMRPASALAFARYTTDHVGGQLAFLRNGVVVFAPKLSQPIVSTTLEISGNLTAEQADDVARLLREAA